MTHGHNSSAQKNKWKLAVMFTLNFGFFLVELIVGYMTRSMSLVADSFHMLSDVAALVVAFIAVKMSSKKWKKNTFGWARAEVLGALVNAVFLIALCFSIVAESIKRFVEPEPVERPLLVLIVGAIGLLMNLVGLCIFREPHSHSHQHNSRNIQVEPRRSTLTHSNRLTRMVSSAEGEGESDDSDTETEINVKKKDNNNITNKENNDEQVNQPEPPEPNVNNTKPKPQSADQMNIRGVFLHLLADALGSVIVVISALVIWLTDWEYKLYIDPALSVIMVALILVSVYPLLIESSLILLQTVPTHIKVEELENKLLSEIDGVLGVHELHIWQLAGERIIATAHIRCRDLQGYFQIAEKVKEFFHNEGIHSTTIQPEFSEQSIITGKDVGDECYLSCAALSTTGNCTASTCCGPIDSRTSSLSVTVA